jgi:hypothetical protein
MGKGGKELLLFPTGPARKLNIQRIPAAADAAGEIYMRHINLCGVSGRPAAAAKPIRTARAAFSNSSRKPIMLSVFRRALRKIRSSQTLPVT